MRDMHCKVYAVTRSWRSFVGGEAIENKSCKDFPGLQYV